MLSGSGGLQTNLGQLKIFSYVTLDQSLSARLQVDRIEAKAMKPLLEYENVCKKARVGEVGLCLFGDNMKPVCCVCVCVRACVLNRMS